MEEIYKIKNTSFIKHGDVYKDKSNYPEFQEKMSNFKNLIEDNFLNSLGKTFYKFGDGDYYFLKKIKFGSARPGRRALKKPYFMIPHRKFVKGAKLNDYYLNKIDKQHQDMFYEIFGRSMDFPSEFVYGLTANKWFFKNFPHNIGLIGADVKIQIIQRLMEQDEYKDYLNLEKFNDYISIPQNFAVDKLSEIEKNIKASLELSGSKIFLVGMGHVKSGLLHKLKDYKKNVQFIDIGVGIDAIAGIVNIERPYFGNWKNYRLKDQAIYENVDFLIRKDKVSKLTTHKFI